MFLDYHSRVPIYEQIKDQIVSFIGQGTLNADDQLPSLRQLSSELSVNINTIKRAFSELEASGVIYSVAGKGVFINSQVHTANIIEPALDDLRVAALKAKTMGATQEEIINIVKKLFEGDETVD